MNVWEWEWELGVGAAESTQKCEKEGMIEEIPIDSIIIDNMKHGTNAILLALPGELTIGVYINHAISKSVVILLHALVLFHCHANVIQSTQYM